MVAGEWAVLLLAAAVVALVWVGSYASTAQAEARYLRRVIVTSPKVCAECGGATYDVRHLAPDIEPLAQHPHLHHYRPASVVDLYAAGVASATLGNRSLGEGD